MTEAFDKKIGADFAEVGRSGLKAWGGFVREEFLPQLSGPRGQKVFREMADNDPVVGAILFAVTMLLRQVEWRVQEADETTEADDAAEFVRGCMDDMSHTWGDFISEVLTMLPFGFAPLELVWKRRVGPAEADPSRRSRFTDGKIGVRKIALRAQDSVVRWLFDDTGGVQGLVQQTIGGPQVEIPIEKLLLFRTTNVKGNPEGRSILRNAYRPWYFKRRIEEVEGIGVERDLAGLPVGRIPAKYLDPNADPAEKGVLQAYKSLVTKIRRDEQEGIILPSERDQSGNYFFDLTLLSASGSRQFNTVEIKGGYAREIATSVLADFIFLGQQAVGSFALSSDKTALFATALGGYLQVIAGVLNLHFLPRLWAFNGFKPDTMPTFVPGDIEKPDLDKLGAFIAKLAAAGMPLFPDRELENALRTMAGLPLAPEDGGADLPDPEEPDDGEAPEAEPQRLQEEEG